MWQWWFVFSRDTSGNKQTIKNTFGFGNNWHWSVKGSILDACRLVLPGSVTWHLCLFVTVCPGLSWVLWPQKEFLPVCDLVCDECSRSWCFVVRLTWWDFCGPPGWDLLWAVTVCTHWYLVSVLSEVGWVPTEVSAAHSFLLLWAFVWGHGGRVHTYVAF